MCQDVYAQRVDAHLSLLNVNHLQHFSEIAKGKILNFKKVHHTSNLFIKEYPPETINTNMIRAYVEKLIRYGMKPDVVLVDYINLLLPSISGRDSMYERIGTVSRELRALSYILGCPICSATQVNRCLTLDTKVVVLRNELEEKIKIKDVHVGDKIKSYNGFNTILKKYPIKTQIVYKITLTIGDENSLYSVEVSSNHMFPISSISKNNLNDKKVLKSINNGLTKHDRVFCLDKFYNEDKTYEEVLMSSYVHDIEEVGEKETIDIELDGDHLFFANSILTHNSGFDTSDVTLANVSESAGIAQTADFVCALFQQEGDREANRIFGKILKNRLGGQLSTSMKSTMEFHIDYETLRLSDAKEVIQDSIDSPVNSILSEVVDNIVN